MDLGLQGKVALVTGGSMGLGKAIAQAFAREGAKVAICARGRELLEAAAREITAATGGEVLPMVADVTREEDTAAFVRGAAERFGRIDILVNNAAQGVSGTIFSLTDQDWQNAFAVKFFGAVHMIRQVVPYMRQQGGGRIIAITGNRAKYPRARMLTAGAVAAAVANLMKALAEELTPQGILLNVVSPSGVITHRRPVQVRSLAQRLGLGEEEAALRFEANKPLGRSATPEELADIVVFLASERAAYIAGTTLYVDGGEQLSAF